MTKVETKINKFESELVSDVKGLIAWTLGLDPQDRQGYLIFSFKERIVKLRLQRRTAHKSEEYELCAAINRHIEKLKIFMDRPDNWKDLILTEL